MKCCKKKCERCEKYSDKCIKYKDQYLDQKKRNRQLLEILERLAETQKIIAEYIENIEDGEKVSGVNIKKKRC